MLKKIKNLRWPVGFALIVTAAAYVPMVYGEGAVDSGYWTYYVPAFIIGSFGLALAFLGAK